MTTQSVTHMVAPAAVGGLERVVHALTLGQAARGWDVRVIVLVRGSATGHPFLEPYAGGDVALDVIALPGRAYVREYRLIRETLARTSPQFVHTHGYYPDVIGGLAARHEGIPTITTSHGFSGGDRKNQFYEWLQRRAFRSFDAVVAVSRVMAAQLERAGVPAQRLHVIRNALPVRNAPRLDRSAARARLGLPDDAFVVGWVGRHAVAKGVDVFVEAVARATSADFIASIIGDGEEGAAARAIAERRGVTDRVRWHGYVPDAEAFLHAFDVFVMSSRSEGTPIALLEAMSVGIPVVATRVGGIPDVVSAHEATLVPPEDPDALGAAIVDVIDNRAAARSRADAASLRARDFGVDAWLDSYDELYRSLLPT